MARVNLTADDSFQPARDGLGFIARKQTSTVFNFGVDVSFRPTAADEEAGVTIFLTQLQHIDPGLDNLNSNGSTSPKLRFHVEASGKPNITVPETHVVDIPNTCHNESVRLSVEATKASTFIFSAAPASTPGKSIVVGSAGAEIVSEGSGPFTGTLVGAYATSNGGNGMTLAFFSRWRYTPVLQEIAAGEFDTA